MVILLDAKPLGGWLGGRGNPYFLAFQVFARVGNRQVSAANLLAYTINSSARTPRLRHEFCVEGAQSR
jgi:hypothetical protein